MIFWVMLQTWDSTKKPFLGSILNRKLNQSNKSRATQYSDPFWNGGSHHHTRSRTLTSLGSDGKQRKHGMVVKRKVWTSTMTSYRNATVFLRVLWIAHPWRMGYWLSSNVYTLHKLLAISTRLHADGQVILSSLMTMIEDNLRMVHSKIRVTWL